MVGSGHLKRPTTRPTGDRRLPFQPGAVPGLLLRPRARRNGLWGAREARPGRAPRPAKWGGGGAASAAEAALRAALPSLGAVLVAAGGGQLDAPVGRHQDQTVGGFVGVLRCIEPTARSGQALID